MSSNNFLLCLIVAVFSAHFCAAGDNCGVNSEVTYCGRDHELTCLSSSGPRGYYIGDCTPGCACSSGYVRSNYTGTCIKFEQCFEDLGCGSNSYPAMCPHRCEPTCGNQNVNVCGYYASPCKPGCRCSPGYVRNEVTKECIRPKDCPSAV